MSKVCLSGPDLSYLNLKADGMKYQLAPAELIEEALLNREGSLADSGALAIDTGKFTGRSPKDRFIVADGITDEAVWWGDINIKFSPAKFDQLLEKVTDYLGDKTYYVRDAYACADQN
ncbi:MAG: phosphoenolpyruvate carboxykinase (ATP), partial [Chryseobacterium sp.]